MKRKLAVILVGLLLIFGMAVTLSGIKNYSILFHNKSNITITYFLYRIDHQIKNHPGPISFAVGTLEPGKNWTVNSEEGTYYIEWFNEATHKLISKSETFTLNQDIAFIIGPLPEEKKIEVKRTTSYEGVG